MTNLLGYYVYFQEANVNSHLAHEERHMYGGDTFIYLVITLPSHSPSVSDMK